MVIMDYFLIFFCCETNGFGGCWWRRYWCSCGYFYGSYCLETVWGNSYRGNWNGGDEGEGDGRGEGEVNLVEI